MKTIIELNKTDLEKIVKNYCNNELRHEARYFDSISIDICPSETRGQREIKCTVIYKVGEE